MIRKTPTQRANEFVNKAIIKKKFNELTISSHDILRLEKFFENYLKTFHGEVPEGLYCTLGKFLTYRDSTDDLYQCYQNLRKFKTGSLEHFTALYGYKEGSKRYLDRSKNISQKIKVDENKRLDKFLRKKCVSSILKKENLTCEQLLELDKLLRSKDYNKFNDNESIVIDLVLNFAPNFVERYNIIKSLSHTDIEYYKARYANNYLEKYHENKIKKVSDAKNNFKNCKEYWIQRGFCEVDAHEKSNLVQKSRAEKAKNILKNQISPRSIEYWINKGYSINDAKETVRSIQVRDLNYYINAYGEDIGYHKYQTTIQSRLSKWYNKSQIERETINKSKGRTYQQLIEKFGEDAANSIIEKRLISNPSISTESKIFFKQLDENLSYELSNISITGYKCPERWINSNGKMYFLDYIINNCVIEYNGSFWHADSRLFKENDWHSGVKKLAKEIWQNDKEKLDTLVKLGYNVLTIWSLDVKEDIQKEINKCKDFLREHLSTSDQGTV
jgi:hypothetical protein